MSKAEILVSGATGRTGGVAIDTLLKMDKRVRAYVRKDGEEAASLRKKGVEIAIGDFTDIDAIHAAMQGVRSAYFLHPISPGIVQASAFFAQAAKEAGVAQSSTCRKSRPAAIRKATLRATTGYLSASSTGLACRRRTCVQPFSPTGWSIRTLRKRFGRPSELSFPSARAGMHLSVRTTRGALSRTS